MKQIPYLCNDEIDFREKIESFKESLAEMPEYSCILATIYVDSYFQEITPRLVDRLKRLLPDVKIVGGTVSANITAGVINLFGISLTFSVFFKSTVDVIAIPWKDGESARLGKDLLWYIRQLYQPVAVQMISSGYNLDLVPFLRELSNIPEDIAVFGGVVDDGTVSGPGFVFTAEEFIPRGMAVVIYKGRSLFVHMCSSSGWQPLGRKMKITALADNQTTIADLDNGTTVRDVYEKYLGVNWNESFLDEAVVFPVCINRNGTILNRMPRALRPDGSANYGADFQIGEVIQLCYGNPTVVIQGTYGIQYDMVRFQPEGIFAVSCWARRVLLNKDVNQELEVCRSCAPSTGIYALGEYVRDQKGRIHLNNMYLSIVGMREGGTVNLPNDMSYLHQKVRFQNKGNSVLSHMLHFVQAVSEELEDYNRQLRHIADTDKLTGMYNRGALDRLLEEEIRRSSEKMEPLSLMVLDVDNFKTINDNFGHLIGDASLVCVANIIQESVLEIDFPGRWGGDEFMVIMRDADSEAAMKIGERIRRNVEAFSMENGMLRMSISGGIATLHGLDDKDSLFKRADDALYRAKYKFGKNNVQIIK